MELSPAKEESANNPFACNICPTKHQPKNKPLLLIECCRGQVIFVRAISLESLSHLFRLPSLLLSHTLQSPFDNSYNDRARFSSLLCRHTVLSNTTMASAADSSKRWPMTDTQCWSEFARLFANYLLRVIEKCVCATFRDRKLSENDKDDDDITCEWFQMNVSNWPQTSTINVVRSLRAPQIEYHIWQCKQFKWLAS